MQHMHQLFFLLYLDNYLIQSKPLPSYGTLLCTNYLIVRLVSSLIMFSETLYQTKITFNFQIRKRPITIWLIVGCIQLNAICVIFNRLIIVLAFNSLISFIFLVLWEFFIILLGRVLSKIHFRVKLFISFLLSFFFLKNLINRILIPSLILLLQRFLPFF